MSWLLMKIALGGDHRCADSTEPVPAGAQAGSIWECPECSRQWTLTRRSPGLIDRPALSPAQEAKTLTGVDGSSYKLTPWWRQRVAFAEATS